MKILNEEDLLDKGFRKRIIAEIEGDENQQRKFKMKRRYDVYKDNTKEFVLAMMKAESEDEKVVQEIIHRLANISFCRKIIEKKAMVYKDGVKREVTNDNEAEQEQVDQIMDFVNMNSTMKKTNKYTQLFKNAVGQVLPYKCPATDKYYYTPTVLMPFLYDVIEDQNNPEIPRVFILSYFTQQNSDNHAPENKSGMREFDGAQGSVRFNEGDGKDQIIADSPDDAGVEKKQYIWWSNKFHFTTDEKGQLVPGMQDDNLKNPIEQLPFYNFSQDQDGHFWAQGGEDIIDGSILLNILLTDLFYIAKYQGMGVGYMFGKGVGKNMKVGASSFITMEVEEGDPTPQIGFATSSPPIQSHLDMIETYIAFLLSTNNLEPGSISAKLTAPQAASGIHEMVKRAENVDDIQDQREIYRDGEPVLFEIMKKWHNLYLERGQLVKDLEQVGNIPKETAIKVKFPDPQPFITEKEKLEIIKLRLDLGIDSMMDSMLKDDPELSEKEAQAKLKSVMEEKLVESSNKLKLFAKENPQPAEEQEEQEESFGKQDDV